MGHIGLRTWLATAALLCSALGCDPGERSYYEKGVQGIKDLPNETYPAIVLDPTQLDFGVVHASPGDAVDQRRVARPIPKNRPGPKALTRGASPARRGTGRSR